MQMSERKVSSVLAIYATHSFRKDGSDDSADNLPSRFGLGAQRLRSLQRASTLSLSGPPAGLIEVALVSKELKRTEITSLQQRRGALFLPIDELRERICTMFQWKSCIITSHELSTEITDAGDLVTAWHSYQVSESQRRRDALEAVLESVRAALASDIVELQFQSLHALWELACDQLNHKYMSYSLFESLHVGLKSPEIRVQSIAAASIWKLAENPATLIRLPVKLLVPCLLKQLLSSKTLEPTEEASEIAAEAAAKRAMKSGSLMFCEKIVTKASKGDESDGEEDDHEQNAARAVSGTGFSIAHQRCWLAGALLACTKIDAGLTAFHKTGKAFRLLPMLEASPEQSPAVLKSAVTALLGQAITHSNPLLKAVMLQGGSVLVRLVSGLSGGAHPYSRLQAAELLKYMLARVRLNPRRPRDLAMLEIIPKLIGELRAAAKPLMHTIVEHIASNTNDSDDGTPSADDADDAAMLLKSILAAIWGFATILRDADREILGSQGMFALVRKMLDLAPERATFANHQAERISKMHGKSIRSHCLGIISTMTFGSSTCVSAVSASMRVQEQAAFEVACKHLGIEKADEELDVEARAAERIQAQRRGLVARREVEQMEMPASIKKRRLSLARVKSAQTTMSIEEDIVFGPIQGRQLADLQSLAQEMLSQLETTVGKGIAPSRVSVCYAAALSSIAPLATKALIKTNAIDRVLSICDQLRKASFMEVLAGAALKVNSYLLSALLALVAKDHPGTSTTKPDSQEAKVPGYGSGGIRLGPSQLQLLIRQMRGSQAGGKIGAAIIWLQACLGAGELIGDLGGTVALCGLLTNAVADKALQGGWADQAQWLMAALWRLSFWPSNAQVLNDNAAPALLAAMSQTEHPTLSSAALGCVNVMLVSGPSLASNLSALGAGKALHDLAGSNKYGENGRFTATRTLDDVQNGNKDETPFDEQDHDAEGDASLSQMSQSPLDALFVSLLNEPSEKLRALGSRGVARAAQRGVSSCKFLVSIDAPKHVMAVLRSAARPVLRRAAELGQLTQGTMAQAVYSPEEDLTSAPASAPVPAALPAEASLSVSARPNEFGERSYELLHDALNAALNLSGSIVAQVPLAKYGLWCLVELLFASQKFRWGGELGVIGEMASDTLSNLALHPLNRTPMYKAELRLKTAVWSGGALTASTMISSSTQELDDLDKKDSPTANVPFADNSTAVPADAAPEDDSAEPDAQPEGEEHEDVLPVSPGKVSQAPSSPDVSTLSFAPDATDVKMRYMDWLDTFDEEKEENAQAAERAQADLERLEEAEGGEKVSDRVLLARAAFTLMDINEDGDLSRLEMVRAFRLDERVRELLLPLLPIPAVSRDSVTGGNLQEQIDAFEHLFQMLDSDGSDGVSLHEFESFFKIMDLAKKKKSASAAAARKRLLQQPKPHKYEEPPAEQQTTRGGSPRWPSPAGGGIRPKTPSSHAAPRLDSLMRRNGYDTWRKPLADQLPKTNKGGLKQHKGRQPTSTHVLTPLKRTTNTAMTPGTEVSLDDTLSKRSMRHAASMPTLKPRTPDALSTRSGTPASGIGAALSTRTGTPASGSVAFSLHSQRRFEKSSRDVLLAPSQTSAAVIADPWSPSIRNIADIAEKSDGRSPLKKDPSLRPFEKRYLETESTDKLRFKVELPSHEEYTSSFKFDGPKGPEDKSAFSGTLVSWVGVEGSMVGEYVAPSFMMPDGKLLRVFHSSIKRNARTPLPEPIEVMPDTLAGLGVDALPIKLSPLHLNEHDVPKTPEASALRAPFPVKSLLDQTNPPPSFGEITTEPIAFLVREKAEASAEKQTDSSAPTKPPFKLEGSIFSSRKKNSDAHSFFTTDQILHRCFAIDWSRCNTPRFRALIAKEDDGGILGANVELVEVRNVLEEFASTIYGAFTYYCALGSAEDGYAMGRASFYDFLGDIKLVDNTSKYLGAGALESIFTAANIEEKTTDIEQKELNEANSNCALMRFEFIQVIVRLAIAKYVRDTSKPCWKGDVSEGVYELMTNDIVPNMPKEVTRDVNAFRRKRLYKQEAEDVLRKYEKPLATIFEYYSSVDDDELQFNLKPQPPSMSMEEFNCFLTDAGLLRPQDGADLRMPGISPVQARLCFMWSQAFVSDELKRRHQLTTCSFVDFLEIMGRLTTFMRMPEPEVLEKYECKTAKEFYDQIATGVHEGSVMVKTTEGPGQRQKSLDDLVHAFHWYDEEVLLESIDDSLEMLVSLILDRLDESGDGKIERADLVQRRRTAVLKSQELIKKRDSSYKELSRQSLSYTKK